MCYSLSVRQTNIIKNFKKNNPHVCYYCGKVLKENEVTADHKIPVSRGGETIIENLAICCYDCNQDKSDMTEAEYKDYLVKKKDIMNESSIYINIIRVYDDVINEYNGLVKTINEKNKEKIEIEKIIATETCNAAEGYNLYRDLKSVLVEINRCSTRRNEMLPLNNHAVNSKKEIDVLYQKDIKAKIGSLRNSLGIGRLASLHKEAM